MYTTRHVYYANTDARADYAQRIVSQAKDSVVFSYLTNGNLAWRQDARGTVSRVQFRYYAGTNQL
jgi:hypothetical protein